MVEVVAALIWQGDKFMICQRPAHKARGLLWEFVGGKVESGETKEQALVRECKEELDIILSVGDVFMELIYEYPDITVHLTLFNATIAEGEPQKLEHNDIRWITPSEISNYEFCPADEEILCKIQSEYYYKKHLEFTKSIINVGDISDNRLNEHCYDLLASLPKNKKLYKYRSLKGKSFGFAYDSLKEGYMWIPPANTLNDDFDSILLPDSLFYQKGIAKHIFKDHNRLIFQSIKRNAKNKWEQDENLKLIPFESFLKCFDRKSGAIIDSAIIVLLDNFFDSKEDKIKYLNSIGDFVKKCIMIPEANAVEIETYKINKHMRNSIHVFSMSDSYDLDNMWGYYSDSGEGFCIEYDFNKIKNLSDGCKKLLLNTYKVNYSSDPKCFDIEAFVEFSFFENHDLAIYNRLISSIIDQIVSKDITWEHEREWRIVLGNIESKVPIDMVSGVIIDRRSMNKTNAKKLIRLCKQKGWSIKVRCSSPFDNTHFFVDYDEYIEAFGEK